MSLFTIIMPTYNVEEFIYNSVSSVLNQSYEDFELIIVDDNSSDKTKEIIQMFLKIDNRIKVFNNESNKGPAYSRNIAFDNAKGEYIVFLDSDDKLDYNALSVLKEKIDNNKKPDVIIFGAQCFGVEEEDIPVWIKENFKTRDVLYKEFCPNILFVEKGARPFLWQSCIKLDLLNKNKLRIPTDLDIGEDQVFEFKYLPFSKNILFIKEKLYFYNLFNINSIMSKYYHMPCTKINKHFSQIKHIMDVWESYGILNKYIVDLTDFYFDFIGIPITNLVDSTLKVELASTFLENLKLFNIPFIEILNFKSRKIYFKILNISKCNNFSIPYYQKKNKRDKLLDELNSFRNCESYKIGKILTFGGDEPNAAKEDFKD